MRLNRLTTVLALPLMGACATLEPSSGPLVTVAIATEPLDLAIGDTARITITVRNVGDREVSVGSAGCNMDFFISDADGNAYTPAELVYCTLELRAPVLIAPGQSHRIDAFTTGRVTRQGSQDDPIMLRPGQYRIRPVVSVLSDNETAVVVSSDPLTVFFR